MNQQPVECTSVQAMGRKTANAIADALGLPQLTRRLTIDLDWQKNRFTYSYDALLPDDKGTPIIAALKESERIEPSMILLPPNATNEMKMAAMKLVGWDARYVTEAVAIR